MPLGASLEIHQVDVGQGDCTVVINRDLAKLREIMNRPGTPQLPPGSSDMDIMPWCRKRGISLLGTVKKALVIDGGNDCYGFALREYLIEVGVIDRTKVWHPDLSLLVTHYHDDHQDGLRSMMRDPAPAPQGMSSSSSNSGTVEKVRPGKFYRLAEYWSREIGTGRFQTIICDFEFSFAPPEEKTKIISVKPGGLIADGNGPAKQCVISLGDGESNLPIGVRIVAADRKVLGLFATLGIPTEVPARRRRRADGQQVGIDQNDRSMVLIVEYGSFRHLVGGDAGGSTGIAYADIESVLRPALQDKFMFFVDLCMPTSVSPVVQEQKITSSVDDTHTSRRALCAR